MIVHILILKNTSTVGAIFLITYTFIKISIMSKDQFQAHDYYFMDEMLSDEHKLIRDSARAWVKKEVSPIIEQYYEKSEFPNQILDGLASIGGFGPYIPEEYGGAGLDQISYGLIMQELKDVIQDYDQPHLFRVH